MPIKSCATCANHLGGGDCALDVEDECGKGEHELWEPITKEANQ